MQAEKEVTRVKEADKRIEQARQNEAQGYLVIDDMRVERSTTDADSLIVTFATPHGNWTTEESFDLPRNGAYSSAPKLAEFLNRVDYDDHRDLFSLIGTKIDAYYDNGNDEWVIGRNPRREAQRQDDSTTSLLGTGDKMALAAFFIIPWVSLTVFGGALGLILGFSTVIPIALWCDQFNE